MKIIFAKKLVIRIADNKKPLSLLCEAGLIQEFITCTAQKVKFSITDFFSKSDQIGRKLRIWSHLLKKSVMENYIICTVSYFLVFWVFDNRLPNYSTKFDLCASAS